MKVILVIQARNGSSRLPNKMMLKLAADTVLAWVIKRASRSKETDLVVLALPDTDENDDLENLARGLGCEVYRGSERDVLKRITLSLRKYQPDIVVRLCADRPLVDPEILDETVRLFIKYHQTNRPLDLVFSHQAVDGAPWPYGFGVEVLSYPCLYQLYKTVTDPIEREHVTLHMWNHPQRYRIKPLPCPETYSVPCPNLKFDLDTPSDLSRLQNLVTSSSDLSLPGYEFVSRAVTLQI
ncbi:cytidyltransferase [Rhodobacterales bacterium FZCC0069]|nr:cytidyltransferase [Rhodobacterales bacterium FZCC0069]